MNKIILFSIFLTAHVSFSQNTYPPNGNVNMDTSLKIGKQEAPANTPGQITRLSLQPFGHTGGLWNFIARDINYGSLAPALTIRTDGLIGINTTNPVSKLSVNGSLTINGSLTNTSPRPAISSGTMANGEIRAYSNAGHLFDDGFLRISAGGGTGAITKSYIELSGHSTLPDMNRNIVFGTNGAERMRINLNGNIGIGTTIPDEKLTVKGKIHTQEVRVDMSGPLVPDYVFAQDYKLKSLQEVENYIKENKHLPEIPSAQEIEKNGLMLAEMNMNLLKKVEELTLYIIEIKKENIKQNEIQNKKILSLENKLKNKTND
jgi:hypothetical protein